MAEPQISISEILIPRLQDQFGDRGLRVGIPPSPAAIVPAIHPEVGDIQIYDDGDELTVVAGHFTHGHFSNYDEKLTSNEKAQQISEEVLAFLEELFADRIVLWGSHKSSGGWFEREADDVWVEKHTKGMKKYVWSGPLE